MIRHAGLLALHGPGGWRGVLIEGPSGAGKSDLAIRALEHGFRLVADDRVLVWASMGGLFGRAPDTLRDLIEARGLGVLPEPALPLCEIALIARCGAAERVPQASSEEVVGVTLPVVILDPREPSAPAKLRRALDAFDAGRKRRI